MILVHNIYNSHNIKSYAMCRYLLRVNIFKCLLDTVEILDDARFLFTSAILKLFHSEARSSPVLLESHVAQKPRSAFRRPFFSAPWFKWSPIKKQGYCLERTQQNSFLVAEWVTMIGFYLADILGFKTKTEIRIYLIKANYEQYYYLKHTLSRSILLSS